MRLYERLASTLIGTPLQYPAEKLKWAMGIPARLRYPELREIYLEPQRIDELMAATIKDGMNCIDVGCHLGSVLQRIVRLSPHGSHVAVEPLPYKAAWLRQKFPDVEVHQIALGDEDGVVEFFYNRRTSGYSGLREHQSVGKTERLQVECRRLDDIVPAYRAIAFLKVDVEGGEYMVLRGARTIIHRSRPIILFECTNSGLASFGYSIAEIYSFFTNELGYRIFLIKDWLSGEAPLTFSELETSMSYPFRAFNYVAAKI